MIDCYHGPFKYIDIQSTKIIQIFNDFTHMIQYIRKDIHKLTNNSDQNIYNNYHIIVRIQNKDVLLFENLADTFIVNAQSIILNPYGNVSLSTHISIALYFANSVPKDFINKMLNNLKTNRQCVLGSVLAGSHLEYYNICIGGITNGSSNYDILELLLENNFYINVDLLSSIISCPMISIAQAVTFSKKIHQIKRNLCMDDVTSNQLCDYISLKIIVILDKCVNIDTFIVILEQILEIRNIYKYSIKPDIFRRKNWYFSNFTDECADKLLKIFIKLCDVYEIIYIIEFMLSVISQYDKKYNNVIKMLQMVQPAFSHANEINVNDVRCEYCIFDKREVLILIYRYIERPNINDEQFIDYESMINYLYDNFYDEWFFNQVDQLPIIVKIKLKKAGINHTEYKIPSDNNYTQLSIDMVKGIIDRDNQISNLQMRSLPGEKFMESFGDVYGKLNTPENINKFVTGYTEFLQEYLLKQL